MKKTHFILILILTTTVSYTQDSLKVKEIPASYANHTGRAQNVKKDSLYIFRTSDIYLVPGRSFIALEKIYKDAKNQNEMTSRLLDNYTKTLKRNIQLENQLKINFKEGDSLDKIVYEKTQATLTNTQRALDYTINSLEKATNSLEIVEKNTKRQRAKSTFEKILFALGGVGIGVLVGVSL